MISSIPATGAEMKTKKGTWQAPELTILVRSRPEEAVLATCKTATVATAPGPNRKECSRAPTPCMDTNLS